MIRRDAVGVDRCGLRSRRDARGLRRRRHGHDRGFDDDRGGSTGIDTTIPPETTLTSVSVRDGTATVELAHAQTAPTAFDV